MRITYDPSGGAAYVYLVQRIEPGEAQQQVLALDGDLLIDLDANGKILGIEILAADRLLRPETLASAEQLA
jgi:uncharacterized protein YuzE